MKHLKIKLWMLITGFLTLATTCIVEAGMNQWTCTGQLSSLSDNQIVTSMVISPDGKHLTLGTANDSICDYTHTPPSVSTIAASNITLNKASLNGAVNANSSNTKVVIEYGETVTYGSTLTPSPFDFAGTSPISVSAQLLGLVPESTYHYRIVATNSGGISYGDDYSFMTAQPVLTLATSGNGIGQITTDIGNIACQSSGPGSCNSPYHYKEIVSLTVTTALDTAFTGWSGSCAGVFPCVLTMTDNHDVTGAFSLGAKARATSTSYLSISDAYNGVTSGAEIKALAGDHTIGDMVLNSGSETNWVGGCNDQFAPQEGQASVLIGTLSVRAGSLRARSIILKSSQTLM